VLVEEITKELKIEGEEEDTTETMTKIHPTVGQKRKA
jgi:hypothetical protein